MSDTDKVTEVDGPSVPPVETTAKEDDHQHGSGDDPLGLMSCGGCGGKLFRVGVSVNPDEKDRVDIMVLKCAQCDKVIDVRPERRKG